MKTFRLIPLAAALTLVNVLPLSAQARFVFPGLGSTYTDYDCSSDNSFSSLTAVHFQCNNHTPTTPLVHTAELPVYGTIDGSQPIFSASNLKLSPPPGQSSLQLTNTIFTLTNHSTLSILFAKALSLTSNSQLLVSGSALNITGGHITTDTSSSITLKDNSTLTWNMGDNELPLDAATWHFQGPTKFTFQALIKHQLQDKMASAFNADTTLEVSNNTNSRITFIELPNSASQLGTLILNGGYTKTAVLPKNVQFRPQSTLSNNLIYNGTDARGVEKLTLESSPTPSHTTFLTLTGNLGAVDLSKIGGQNSVINLMNSDTHYTELSTTNLNLIPIISSYTNQAQHIQYDGHSADWLPKTGLYSNNPHNRPSLQLNNPLPPLDLTLMPSSSGVFYDFKDENANKQEIKASGIIILNADQTITNITNGRHNYSVEILTGKTLSWSGTDLSKLSGNLPDGNPILILHRGSMVRLTAPGASWGANAFTHLDDQGLIVVFGTTGTQSNMHYVTLLPETFGVSAGTELVYTPNTFSGRALLNAHFIEGSVQDQETLDFAQAVPFPHVWNVTSGSGSIVLNTAHFEHPESWAGHSDILIAAGPQSLQVRLEGASKVTVGGKEYTYQVVQRAVPAAISPTSRSTSSALIASLHSNGSVYAWYLKITTPGMAVVPPTPHPPHVTPPTPETLLGLGQPALEAQIRFDLSRLDRDLWHTERATKYGLNTWIKGVGTFQMRDTVDIDASHYGRKAHAVGVNLGAEYLLSLDTHKTLALSLATEWLTGVREVGDLRFDEQRWNTGIGVRLQKDDIYGAFSTQWTQVWHSLDASSAHKDLSQDQYAFAINAEVGKTLHMTPVVDLTPFAQYNWTSFDKTYASSEAEKAQQHLQLGAYLNMPWVSPDGVTVRNRLGLATVLSIFSNDSASFQASWKLRLSGERLGSHLGIQLETTAEYAPADNRMGLDVTLGADYAF